MRQRAGDAMGDGIHRPDWFSRGVARRAARISLGLVLMLTALPLLADEFQARLGRTPVDARNQASVTGRGEATAELDGKQLRVSGRFSGLQGPATAASLHMGQALGVRGPVIHALEVTSGADGSLRGTIELTDEQIAALRAGRLYIQVDSAPAPEGNLWGWLLE
jgi:hypothetical protein